MLSAAIDINDARILRQRHYAAITLAAAASHTRTDYAEI